MGATVMHSNQNQQSPERHSVGFERASLGTHRQLSPEPVYPIRIEEDIVAGLKL